MPVGVGAPELILLVVVVGFLVLLFRGLRWLVNRRNNAAPDVTLSVVSPGAYYVPKRPSWPSWVVLVGVLLLVYFGWQAYYSSQVIQRVEASTATKVAGGLNWLGQHLGVGNVGAAVDPRNEQLYVLAKEKMTQGLVMAGAGVVLILLGLVAAASWNPGPVYHGPPERSEKAN